MITAIFDANYMARRAFFSATGRDLENGTVFGFLRDVAAALEYLSATTAVFCWDSALSKRFEIFPGYKASRAERYKKMDADERKREHGFQIDIVRISDHLRDIGYANIFRQRGYEADDLIAAACAGFTGRKYLVSSDKDLWQLLAPDVSCWNPQQKKMTTRVSFCRSYKILPENWVEVKVIAGCETDDIPGVSGFGEPTAVKYIRDGLPKKSKLYGRIEAAAERVELNRRLVRLPFPGTQPCRPQPGDNPTAANWAAVAKKLQMPFLAGLFPGGRNGQKF